MLSVMAYVEPQHEPQVVDLAGDSLVGLVDAAATPLPLFESLPIINNWRGAHGYPLNTFNQTLRRWTHDIDPSGVVYTRIKRLPAIEQKLRDHNPESKNPLKLSEIQDIGGCRSVVSTVEQVYRLVSRYKDSEIKHTFEYENDYIQQPRSSGYRSVHRIYRHFSRTRPMYNGLRIEIQLRSQLQHTWATAVETSDTMLSMALKSNRGEKDWKRFFILMGSAIALRENCPPVQNSHKTESSLKPAIQELATKLDVLNRLRNFGTYLQVTQGGGGAGNHYQVLVLDPTANTLIIYGFRASQSEEAYAQYLQMERTKPSGGDVVLVAVADMAAIRRAYPNYHLDTQAFRDLLLEITS